MAIKIDVFRKRLSYRCSCGKQVYVPFQDVVAESRDYCGCGRKVIALADANDVAKYQLMLGTKKLD